MEHASGCSTQVFLLIYSIRETYYFHMKKANMVHSHKSKQTVLTKTFTTEHYYSLCITNITQQTCWKHSKFIKDQCKPMSNTSKDTKYRLVKTNWKQAKWFKTYENCTEPKLIWVSLLWSSLATLAYEEHFQQNFLGQHFLVCLWATLILPYDVLITPSLLLGQSYKISNVTRPHQLVYDRNKLVRQVQQTESLEKRKWLRIHLSWRNSNKRVSLVCHSNGVDLVASGLCITAAMPMVFSSTLTLLTFSCFVSSRFSALGVMFRG